MNDNFSLYEMVDNIVQVVFYTHFSYITEPELKKDLWQIGFLKAYELLNNGNYDPTMSLRNFLYTGIRNEMHNTLYHLGKIKTVSLDELDVYKNVVGYTQTREYTVEEEIVNSVCKKFRRHGNYTPFVINYLIKLGLIEGDRCSECEVDRNLLNPIITLTLWELYESEVING